ncbi:MAG TPA: nucleoside-diphosphate sugar epimerase/dehydratase [Actinomycetota bacterium]|nr:nucleoside-diphosphate sugar epimerase/dehydratase [Actinomycetota bacterium]
MDIEDERQSRSRLRAKVTADLLVWLGCGFLAFVLRVPDDWRQLGSVISRYTLISLPVVLFSVVAFRLHRTSWRRFAVDDVPRLAAAVGTGSGCLFVIGSVWSSAGLFWLAPSVGFPRTVPLIQGFLAFCGMAAARVATRALKERDWRRQHGASVGRPRRVLLLGAGEAGTLIADEIRRRGAASGLEAVGFLDDDGTKAPLKFARLKVLGGIDDLPRVVAEHGVDQILITMPSAPGSVIAPIVASAAHAGVPCRILPGITQVLAGNVALSGVRAVQVEDLLRRAPIELRIPPSYIEGRTVLVTGAGGSIGSELVRQVADLDPAAVVLLGHGENALYTIGRELQRSHPRLHATIVVADVRDRTKMAYVLDGHRPAIVLHAAAHKHVPLMEADPDEAILNNVAGTKNLVETSLAAGVLSLVNVSSDKAVSPTSVLGATKWLGEEVVRMTAARADAGQSFVSVRFGNVLGSRGSVVPAFQAQISQGGPVTVTDPEMTRYFMTIPEASRLVIQAGALGGNGDVYVLNMGTPVPSVDLARDMIRLAGAQDDGVRIEFTGPRPGEKTHEELFTEAERHRATAHDDIVVVNQATGADQGAMEEIDLLIDAAARRDWADIGRHLGTLIPGFVPSRLGSPEPSVPDGRS